MKHRMPQFAPLIPLAAVPLVSEFFCPVLVLLSFFMALPLACRKGWKPSACGKLLLVYIGYLLLSFFYGHDPLSVLSEVLLWVEAAAVLFVVTVTVTTRVAFYRFLTALSVVAGTVGVLAVVGYLFYRTGLCGADALRLWNPLERWLCTFLPFNIDLSVDHGRAAATFANPNILCEYLVMVLPFVCCGSFYIPDRTMRRLCSGGLIAVLAGVVVTFSRGGYLAVLLLAVFFLFGGGFGHARAFLGATALAALIPRQGFDRFITIGNIGDIAISTRLQAWQITVGALPRYWLFGAGAGIMTSWDLLSANGSGDHHTHNLILQLLLQGGIIGLGLVVAMGIFLIRTGVQLIASRGEYGRFGLALVGFFITFVTHGMFDWPLLCPKQLVIFGTALALCDVMQSVFFEKEGILRARSW